MGVGVLSAQQFIILLAIGGIDGPKFAIVLSKPHLLKQYQSMSIKRWGDATPS